MADDWLNAPWTILHAIAGVPPPQNTAPVPPRITAMAPGSNVPDPQSQALAQNPLVSQTLDKAWAASNPDVLNDRHEQGGWIRQNYKGDMWVQPWPQGGSDFIHPDSINGHPYMGRTWGGVLDRLMGNETIGEYHTHPTPTGTPGPSPQDRGGVQQNGLPGIIQGRDGLYIYGGQVPQQPLPPIWKQWLS